MATVTLTRRTRSLGFGWCNDLERTQLGLRVREVAGPDVTGSLRAVTYEAGRAGRLNLTNDWRSAWFVAGRRVLRIVEPSYCAGEDLALALRDEGRVVVEVED